ncbi:MAG: glycosyltransferase family 4 protein [FCB group bacterium]|nr:glycosyltransferase family 4 protein [FCB group bacterium]
MKIFILPSWYPSRINPASGAFFRDRARILQRAGHEPIVIASIVHSLKNITRWLPYQPPPVPTIENGLCTYRTETVNLFPKSPRLSFFLTQRKLRHLLHRALDEQGKPDLVFAHSSLWAGAALAELSKSLNIPFVVSEHLKEFLAPKQFTTFQKTCIQRSHAAARRIIVTSTALESAIATQFPDTRNKLVLIPNPADINAFPLKPPGLIQTDQFVFITTALFRPEKRIDLLLNAFKQLLRSYPNSYLRIVGDGPEKRKLMQLAERLEIRNRVEFCGFLDKQTISQKLLQSDAFVLASEVETFGVALIEAMACGLPVVSTRCGGPNDIVTEETGLLVEPNNAPALAAAMGTLIEKYDAYSPARIREITLTKYGDQAYVKAIEGLV